MNEYDRMKVLVPGNYIPEAIKGRVGMNHPFLHLGPRDLQRTLWTLLVSTMFLLSVLTLMNQSLVTVQAPSGIISFELADSQAKANSIMDSWDSHQHILASFSLGLDYLFLLVYSTTLSLGCVWTSRIVLERKVSVGVLGLLFAWLAWAAALLDGIENYTLFRILMGNSNPFLPQLASWCAELKFGIIFAGILWIIFALCLRYIFTRTGKS